jgi:hypothetical protein
MAETAQARDAQLRGTSDQLLLAIQSVALLEQQKRGVPFGDDGFPDLARAVRAAAEIVLDLALAEEREADRIHARSETDGDSATTIAATAPTASLAEILDEWRGVERRLAAAPAGSHEALALLDAFEQLRSRYATTLAEEGRRAKAKDLGST